MPNGNNTVFEIPETICTCLSSWQCTSGIASPRIGKWDLLSVPPLRRMYISIFWCEDVIFVFVIVSLWQCTRAPSSLYASFCVLHTLSIFSHGLRVRVGTTFHLGACNSVPLYRTMIIRLWIIVNMPVDLIINASARIFETGFDCLF